MVVLDLRPCFGASSDAAWWPERVRTRDHGPREYRKLESNRDTRKPNRRRAKRGWVVVEVEHEQSINGDSGAPKNGGSLPIC